MPNYFMTTVVAMVVVMVVVVVVVMMMVVVVVTAMIFMSHGCGAWCITITPAVQRMPQIRRKTYLLYFAKYSVI